ncbi:MAG: hypothetical protein AAF657_26270 [Acidobacteriota bacterium]
MPELSEKAAPADAVRQQIEMLDQFENYRRTWELELLISGAVVFALLGVPARLDDWFFSFSVHISRSQFMPVFYGYFYLKLIAYSLIVTFCVNLSLRAYWIGLIGLGKVFPDGIRWEEVKEGPISLRLSKSFPSLQQLTQGADKVCSLIFSSSFIIVFIFVFSIVLVSAITLVAFLISLAIPGAFGKIFFGLLVPVFVLPGIVAQIDKSLAKKPPEAWEGRWFVKPIQAILKGFYWVTARPLFSSIQLTLASNVNRKISVPLFISSFVLLFGFFMVSMILRGTDRLLVHGYTMFPDVNVERGIDYGHYENLRPEGEIYRRYPSIQSDIIEDPFIKLFIPYSPRDNDDLARLCRDVEPVPQQGFRIGSRTRVEMRPTAANLEAALACLGSFQRIFINGERIEPAFDYFTRSDTEVRGIMTYLPVEGLPKGKNLLHIERVETEEPGQENGDGEKIEFFIPFWI